MGDLFFLFQVVRLIFLLLLLGLTVGVQEYFFLRALHMLCSLCAGFGLILLFRYGFCLFNCFLSSWVFFYFCMGFSFRVSRLVWAFCSCVGDFGFVVWVS